MKLHVFASEDYVKAKDLFEYLDKMDFSWECDVLGAVDKLWADLKEKLRIPND